MFKRLKLKNRELSVIRDPHGFDKEFCVTYSRSGDLLSNEEVKLATAFFLDFYGSPTGVVEEDKRPVFFGNPDDAEKLNLPPWALNPKKHEGQHKKKQRAVS